MLRSLVALLGLPALVAAAPVLDRDVSHYTVLGLRRVRLKNFAMEPPGCHVGVNCSQPDPNSPCGQLNAKHARCEGAGQLGGGNLCATESFFEVDDYNQTGDTVAAPWGTPTSADPRPCDLAARRPCTVLDPTARSAP